LAALVASCSDAATEHPPRAVVEGRTVYVIDVNSEQDGRSAAVSACRARGGSAVFAEIVAYRYLRRAPAKAARFDCTV
jgi:hypothetical protein